MQPDREYSMLGYVQRVVRGPGCRSGSLGARLLCGFGDQWMNDMEDELTAVSDEIGTIRILHTCNESHLNECVG
jgi:hypothetical protein